MIGPYIGVRPHVSSGGGASPPDAPVQTAPSTYAATSYSINWGASSGATEYFVDVATDAGFTSLVVNNLNVGNVTTYSVTGLTQGVLYYSRIRASNGAVSANSNVETARTYYDLAVLWFARIITNGDPGMNESQKVAINNNLFYEFITVNGYHTHTCAAWAFSSAYVLTEIQARTSIIGNFFATPVNSPTWGQGVGYDPIAANSYINSNFVPATDGGSIHTLNNAGVYGEISGLNISQSNLPFGCYDSNVYQLYLLNLNGDSYFAVNGVDHNDNTGAAGAYSRFSIKTTDTLATKHLEGVVYNVDNTPAGLPTRPVFIGTRNNDGSPGGLYTGAGKPIKSFVLGDNTMDDDVWSSILA